MINISNLTYEIGKTSILKGLNLTVETGQYYALAGVNGAGKSTLIKIILDLIQNVQSGQVSISGLDNHLQVAREQLTYLPEKFDIKKDVTGWQYIRFVFGVYKQPINRTRVEELSTQLSLEASKLNDRTSTYSKGMRQKLGLISCFMLDKPLIILDEPLSGLDPKARFYFKRLLAAEKEFNRTIFYSTHMLADAEEICDRFGILHHGQLIFQGTPSQCRSQYAQDSLEKAYMACISET